MNLSQFSIDDFTSPIDIVAHPDDSIHQLKKKIKTVTYRHIPVVSKGEVVGILSDRDFKILQLIPEHQDVRIREIMHDDVYTVFEGSRMEEVAFEMSKRKIGSAIVKKASGEVEGIFTTTDALNALIEILRGDVNEN